MDTFHSPEIKHPRWQCVDVLVTEGQKKGSANSIHLQGSKDGMPNIATKRRGHELQNKSSTDGFANKISGIE